MDNYNTNRWDPANRRPNVISHNFNQPENKRFNQSETKRFKIYYDNKPTNSYESKNKICLVMRNNGQILRMNESDALEVIMDLAKALKWRTGQTDRPQNGNRRYPE
ncbi:hypothetical protein D3OALGA1CA_4976 [Olavius algarvensis associated proteobacterium Delta 3]|nr:hypothetical protein D3OALGA1CA_4976 [Olavius algarvensis associated proteobacterium Delta 3]